MDGLVVSSPLGKGWTTVQGQRCPHLATDYSGTTDLDDLPQGRAD